MQEFYRKKTLLAHKKLIRITTSPIALAYPLQGQPSYMKKHGYDVLLISSNGKEVSLIQKQEICPFLAVNMTRRITPFRDLWSLYKLVKIFLKHKPDIVHTETPKAGLLGMIAAKLCGVKIRIHTVAGLPLMVEKGFKLWLLSSIEKITYFCANHVWPNGPSMLNYIVTHKLCPQNKLSIIGNGSSNGVDTYRFNRKNISIEEINILKKAIRFDNDCTYFLFVGRMVYDKGIVELVNVFEKLYISNPKLRLILAGRFEKVLDPIPEHIEYNIINHPGITHIPWTDKVEHLMAIANFFIFPSHREGFPNVLLESGLMKLPVVCSNIPGNIDIIQQNKTGLIFSCKNEGDLEEKIIYALQNETTVKEMSEQLHNFVYNNFSRDFFWKKMLEEYNKVSA